ncbi:hypothetical protein FRX31_006868, partial [Thalictrum thalictroides]
MLAFVETKLIGGNSNSIIHGLGNNWNFCHNGDGNNRARIIVFWDTSLLNVQILIKYKQVVHLEVTDLDLNVNYYLTCIYGSNAYQERKELWALIKNWSTNIAKPWALFGDFNACKELSEKEGGTLLSEDINRRTLKKLDRCVVNDEWVAAFDQSFANFIPQLVSDHSAIIVNWKKACLPSSVKPFKFFNHWTSHVEFASLVEQAWAERVIGNPMMRVTSKLKILKNKLKPW